MSIDLSFFFIPNQQKQNESGLFRDKNLKHLFTVFNVGTNMLRANFPLVYIAGFFLCAKTSGYFTNPPVKVTARVSSCCFGNAEIIRVVFVVLVVLVAALILNSGCCVHTVISGHMLYARRTRPQCAHNPV